MITRNNLANIAKFLAVTAALVGAGVGYGEKPVAQKKSATMETWTIDQSKSMVKWVGKKVTGSHNGLLKFKSGTMTTSGAMPMKGSFVVDMNSLTVEDIPKDDKYNEKLRGHLMSDDFFTVSKFPTAKFTIDSAKPTKKGSNEYKMTGKMTIKGITHPISFTAMTKKSGPKMMTASTKFKFDRTKWDVKYNSGDFFDPKKLGDKLIYNDVELEVDMTMKSAMTGGKSPKM